MAGRGRKSSAKERERLRARRVDERIILSALSVFGDPLAAVHAIVSSPLGMHRYLSLAPAVRLTIRAAVQKRPPLPAAGGMQELIDSSKARAGKLPWLEDALPIDARVPAVATFNRIPYRLYPGMLERPLAALRTAELVSQVVDPLLRPQLGFGVVDYVEVCLKHSENAVGMLAPTWPDGPLPEVGDAPKVTTAEVAAAKGLVMWRPFDQWSTEEHRNALKWATVSVGKLDLDLDQGMSGNCFGSALAVAGSGGVRFALPLPYIAESWERTVATLACRAADYSRECEGDWLRIARAEVGQLLTSIHDLPAAMVVQGTAGPAMIIRFGLRHLLVLAVAAGITSFDMRPAERAVAAIVTGATVRTDYGAYRLPDDAEIVRLVVVAPVGSAMIGVTEDVGLVTLEDLQWIVANCDRADELWAFFHEDVVTNKDVYMMGWETSNTWEFWKANGQALHRAGKAPTGIVVAAHQVGGPEWREAADRAPLEVALFKLGLPSSRSMRAIEIGRGPVKVLTPDYFMWSLALLERYNVNHGAVLAERQKGEVPDELFEFSHSLIGISGFVALHDSQSASAALRECKIYQLIISFEYDENISAPIISDGCVGKIKFKWNSSLQLAELEQPGFVQDRLGVLLIDALAILPEAGEAVRAFGTAWRRAPRMLVVSAYNAPLQNARSLVQPRPIPEWAVSQANRRLGQHLLEEGHEVGRRDRAESRKLELGVVVPWLRQGVACKFSRFDRFAVLRRAASEVEAVTAARERERRERTNRAQMPTARLPVENLNLKDDEDAKLAHHSALLTTLLELALASDSSGEASPDDVEWSHLLALAGLFMDSTIRCDALLHEMSSEVIEVSDSFEINIKSVDTTAIGVEAFNRARLQHVRGDVAGEGDELTGQNPEEILAVIDPAMLVDLGCTAKTLMGTCSVISSWTVTDREPVATVPFDELCVEVARELDVEQMQARAAVAALTLTCAGLRAEQVQPWKGRSRDHRLLTRPIVGLDEQTALLLPWATQTSVKVLSGYLSDGLLPWPTSRLERYPALRSALHRVRLSSTRVLENQVEAELRRLGLVVRSRVKQHQARTIGLSYIPGEIDHVAVNSDGVLWVIDDKDLADAFTSAEMARGVRQFFDEKKGEIPKLLAKVDVIRANVSDVSSALGVPLPVSVKGLFVTRSPIPAAFASSSPVSFVTLRHLREVVEGA
jgi:hypothetical protein